MCQYIMILWSVCIVVLFCRQAFSQTIVYPGNGSDMELLAAKEVRRYIYLRTDQKLVVQPVTSLPTTGDLIVVANDDNPMVESLRRFIRHTANPGGFILKTVTNGGRQVLVIAGYDSTATLHAAYRYAEHLGVFFGLAGDAIPDAKITLDLSGLDEVGEPLFETRGILPFHDFFAGPDFWNTADYMAIISQLPKLGMNFIGLHTYNTKYGSQWARDNDVRTGPEPTVWIGLPQDVNPDGTVSWSYPSQYAHTHRRRTWWFDTWNTDQFHAGSSQLFPTNGYGSDVIGPTMPADIHDSNAVFNRCGAMLKEAFTHARNIGVKTAIGTELPLGLEPAGTGDIDPPEDWVRGMPILLQDRITGMGLNPADPAMVKDVYKGIFKRIMKTHPLDYYWLWSYEIWSDAEGGVTPDQIQAFKNDINLARQALAELGNPFQIGHAGWKTGTVANPAELEDVFPPEAPFYSGWGDATGHEFLSAERVKWPGIHMEQDWGLVQPQGGVYAAYEDISAALSKNCNGSIGNIWRTCILSPNITGVKDLHWVYGPTGTPVTKAVPPKIWAWAEAHYHNWAIGLFGPEVASSIAAIIGELDGGYPAPSGWAEEGPGEILRNSNSWSQEQSKYAFVSKLEALRPQIVGDGNLERFDYWLKTMQCLRLMGEYGCVRDDFETAMSQSKWTDVLNYRISMANLFEQIMTLMVEKTTNASDLGEIVHLELVNWKQLMMNKWDSTLITNLGSIPPEANPSMNYTGAACVKVTPARTQVYSGESLTLRVLIMGNPTSATLHYRNLGGSSYTDIPLTHVARGVYSVTIPSQSDDFEYYIEAQTSSGSATFPVTAPSINQTVVVHASPSLTQSSTNSISAGSLVTPEWPETLPDEEWISYHLAHPGPHYASPGDPNGAIYYNGRYHLHYLMDNESPGEGLAWAHVSSTDMVHWQWHPTVLTPSIQQGHHMCSGTAFFTKEGQPAIIYHGSGESQPTSFRRHHLSLFLNLSVSFGVSAVIRLADTCVHPRRASGVR